MVEQTLKREILAGAYNEERRLPADTRVAERFEVSRMTARKALSALQRQGLIRIEHGRGAFVEEDVIDYRILQKFTFTQSISASNRLPSRKLLAASTEPAPDWVCAALGLATGARVLSVKLLGYADARPIAISTSYLDAVRHGAFANAIGPAADVEAALDHFGVSLSPGPVRLVARMPSAEEALYLDQSPSRPVMEKVATDVDAHGIPFWCHITCYSADRMQFIYDPNQV